MNIRRISLKSLWYYLLRRFWIILIFALAFGALLGGYKYYKDKKAADAASEISDGSDLTEPEKIAVENATMQYSSMKGAERYFRDSILMKGNSKEETQTIVQYRMVYTGVPAGQSTGVLENTYQQLLKTYVNDGMFIPDIIEIDPVYEEYPYIRELVWISNSSGEISIGVVENSFYPNLAADFRKVVEDYMKGITEKEPQLKIDLMGEKKITLYDSTTESAQRNASANLITYRRAYLNSYTSFTSSQKAYLRYLLGVDRVVGDEELPEEPSGINLKYVLIGMIAGGFLGIGVLILMLYLSLRHASISDYSENVGLRSFGLMFVKGEKKNFLLRKEFKDMLFTSNEESIKYSAVRIGAYCSSHGIKELSLLSSEADKSVEEAGETLKTCLKKEGIEVLSAERVATDSEALSKLINSGHGLFIEKLHGGNRKKLGELLQFCKENEVTVIGSLGVAELALGEG